MSITNDPTDPRLGHGSDDEPVEQNEVYLVGPAGPLVRPIRESYTHASALGGCGAVTTMHRSIAETYARTPNFYGATYCCGCRRHRPVGPGGEFVWADGTRVGS